MTVVTDPDVLAAFGMGQPTNNAQPDAANASAPAAPSGVVTDPAILKGFDEAPSIPPPPTPGGWSDVIKSLGTGLVQGAAAVPGAVGDLNNMSDTVGAWLFAHGANAMGIGGSDPDALQANIKKGLSYLHPLQGPTTETILSPVADKLHVPESNAGRIVSNVASFIPQALADPEIAVGKGLLGVAGTAAKDIAMKGLVPAAASEGVGQASDLVLGDSASPYARAAGAVAGSVLSHSLRGSVPVERLVANATKGVSDADLAAAQALQQGPAGQVVKLTPAEAIMQATGGKSNMDTLQRNIEGMKQTAPTMAEFMAQRPQQVQTAGRNVFDQIAVPPTAPTAVGLAAQNEAEEALRNIRGGRTNATTPYYDLAKNDTVPQDRMRAVAQQLDALIAPLKNNPDMSEPLTRLRAAIVDKPAIPAQPAIPARPGVPARPAIPARPETYIDNVGQLDNLHKVYRDAYTGPTPLGQSGAQATAGRFAGTGLGYLDNELQAASPALRAGRELHAGITEGYVAPREAGPIGQVSETPRIEQQGAALYPDNPNPGSAGETGEAIGRMPLTGGPVTRNFLERRFNEATQDNMGGPNQFGGAKFAAQVGGNAQQAANIRAGLDALPGAPTGSAYDNLLQTLQATGRRQPVGSRTAFNEQFLEGMTGGPMALKGASILASPEKALNFVSDMYSHYRIGKNATALATMLTSPDGIDQIRKMRASVPQGKAAMLAAALRSLGPAAAVGLHH